jgi:hypothetical protein
MSITDTTYPSPLNKIHPNYLVSITGTDELGNDIGDFQGTQFAGKNYGIIAVLPEEFTLSTASTWNPLLNDMAKNALGQLLSGLGSGIKDIAQAVSGVSPLGVAFTQQVWESTSPVEFRLPLQFNAVYDAEMEVMFPIMRLLSLTLPSTDQNIASSIGINFSTNYAPLKAPGPTLGTNSLYNVTINLGQAFSFSNVIIKGVNATFKTLPVSSGDWVSADVELEVTTSRILTKGDLSSYFRHSRSVGNSGAST